MSEKFKVHYMNAYPGMGKTHYAIQEMHALLSSKKVRPSLIYCAPTLSLLQEVYEDLRNRFLSVEENSAVVKIFNNVNLFKSDAFVYGGSQSIVNKITTYLNTESNFCNRVILMTHEAFSRLPLMESFAKYQVYFDEARKIVIEGTPLPIRSKTDFNILKKSLMPSGHVDGYHQVDASRLERAIRRVKAKTTRKSLSSLYLLLEKASSKRLEVYVNLKEDTSKSSRNSFQAYEIVMPSKLFLLFGYVMLMASHFDESQMYWVLKSDKKIQMIDSSHLLTETKAGETRYARIKFRYRKVKILPLTANKAPLSKTFIKQDILIGERALPLILESGVFSKPASYVRQLFSEPSASFFSKSERALVAELADDVAIDPLTFLLRRARSICSYIRDAEEYTSKPLLVINNGMEQQIYNSGGNDFWDKLPFTSHGLNGYASRNIIVFLAAVQISNGLKAFLKARIPRYDPNLDHVADVCNQAVCRTCVRNPASTAEVYAIVPDLKIAEMLRDKMMGEPVVSEGLLRKHPARMVSLAFMHRSIKRSLHASNEELKILQKAEHREETRKTNLELRKRFHETDAYKAYASASALRHRAKKENHPRLAHYEKQFLKAKESAFSVRDELKSKYGL